MSQDRPLISFDYAAKTVLRDPANFGILSGFLSELLERDVTVQEILESESLKDNAAEGINRVDMKVKIDNAEIVVVEIQFEHEADFLQRTLFGVSKAITSQHAKGELFSDIKKVYSIDIVYFNLSQRKRFFGTERIGDIHPEYYIIEVNKFDETIRTRFDEWFYFLKRDEVKQEFSAKGLKEAKEKLDYLKLSLEEQAEYDRKMNKRSSFKSVMHTARLEGELDGEARGIEKGILQTAKNMKSKGFDVVLISEVTSLSKEEIEEL